MLGRLKCSISGKLNCVILADWNMSFSKYYNTSIFGRLKIVVLGRLKCFFFGRLNCVIFGDRNMSFSRYNNTSIFGRLKFVFLGDQACNFWEIKMFFLRGIEHEIFGELKGNIFGKWLNWAGFVTKCNQLASYWTSYLWKLRPKILQIGFKDTSRWIKNFDSVTVS